MIRLERSILSRHKVAKGRSTCPLVLSRSGQPLQSSSDTHDLTPRREPRGEGVPTSRIGVGDRSGPRWERGGTRGIDRGDGRTPGVTHDRRSGPCPRLDTLPVRPHPLRPHLPPRRPPRPAGPCLRARPPRRGRRPRRRPRRRVCGRCRPVHRLRPARHAAPSGRPPLARVGAPPQPSDVGRRAHPGTSDRSAILVLLALKT